MGYIWSQSVILSNFALLCYFVFLFYDILEENPKKPSFENIEEALNFKKEKLLAGFLITLIINILLFASSIKIKESLINFYGTLLTTPETILPEPEIHQRIREQIEEQEMPEVEVDSINSYNFVIKKSEEVFNVFGREELRKMKELDNPITNQFQIGPKFEKKGILNKQLSSQRSNKEKKSKFREKEFVRKSFSPDTLNSIKKNQESLSPNLEDMLQIREMEEDMSEGSYEVEWDLESQEMEDFDRRDRLEQLIKTNQLEMRNTPTNKRLCVICMEKKVDCVFRPCGHGGCCFECAQKIVLDKASCYCCREPIEKVVHIDNAAVYKDIFKVKDVFTVILEN